MRRVYVTRTLWFKLLNLHLTVFHRVKIVFDLKDLKRRVQGKPF